MKSVLSGFVMIWLLVQVNAVNAQKIDSTNYLLLDYALQLEITDAVDDMYNFDFRKAEVEFSWIAYNYPDHPLAYFLYGISTWWQMMPNLETRGEIYGEEFLGYMDQSIEKAERMLEIDENNAEAYFFLAGAYGFKGRYYSDLKNWTKSTNVGRLALKYLERSRDYVDISPEILFGDGLFNYYAIYIKENYPLLRPVLVFFPKGDKALGIEQLEEVATNAFYTRVEAIYFLMRIKAFDLNETFDALRLSEYIYNKYPNNPYFHRFYARMLYASGQFRKAADVSFEILERIEKEQLGYESVSGRYAAFFLAHFYRSQKNDEEAEKYYRTVISFTEKIEQEESGYYLNAQLYLAEAEFKRSEYERALARIDIIRDNSKRRDLINKEARNLKKEIRRSR